MRTNTNGVVERNGKGSAPGRTTLRLSQAREDTPAVDPVDAVKRSLVMAVYGQIGEDDAEALVETIKKAAAEGDKRSQKILLDLITKTSGKVQVIERPVMVEAGARQLRLLAAYAIDKEGPMSIEAIAKLVGMSDSDAAALLDGCWFQPTPKGIGLTVEGKQQVG